MRPHGAGGGAGAGGRGEDCLRNSGGRVEARGGEAESVYTVSFSKDVFSQGAEYQVFLGVFLMFLVFFHSKMWAKFHLGTFKPYD